MRVNVRAENVAFWLLGLLNNSGAAVSGKNESQPAQHDFTDMTFTLAAVYVIMIAGANDISSGAVGLVYFCAVFPALLVKLSAPYW